MTPLEVVVVVALVLYAVVDRVIGVGRRTRFSAPSGLAGSFELPGRFVVFWSFSRKAWGMWGYRPPHPFLPYDWRFYLGPVCLARLTSAAPRRLSRQERRQLSRTLQKRARSAARLLVLLVGLAVVPLAGCAGARWQPPQDEVSVQVSPGTGWEVLANQRAADGRWYREVRVVVQVLGPRALQGAACTIELSGREVAFEANPDHTWTVDARLLEGIHRLVVKVGGRTRERTLYVWREASNG